MKKISIFMMALLFPMFAFAGESRIDLAQRTAENQIRDLLKPILNRFCSEACNLLSVKVYADTDTYDEFSPGFEENVFRKSSDFVPVSAKIKLLMDEKIGPISRKELLDLIQQHLDTLDYPVKIETQLAHFPMPHGTEGHIAAIRDKIEKTFLANTNELLAQFCPSRCILTDFALQTDIYNAEEARYGSGGEYIQDGDTAIRIKDISATILMDESLTPEEQKNIVEMLKMKNNSFKNVNITGKSLKFPKPMISGEKVGPDKDAHNEANDAVQAELRKFKIFGLIFGLSALALLLFIAMGSLKMPQFNPPQVVQKIIREMTSDAVSEREPPQESSRETQTARPANFSKRFEVERLTEELTGIYAQQPKVAKQVFSRILTEEGVETTAQYMSVFGESIVLEMLRDPSLQTDVSELLDYFSKNPLEISEDKKLDLLRKLHNRTVAGKLIVFGNRSSSLFDFLSEMEGMQILELIRTESVTVKAIALTQCDPQKRATIFAQLDPDIRIQLLAELSRIDYLPRDYVFNVSSALRRKKRESPKLNTESLPGSEVLVSLLERTGMAIQKSVVNTLETADPMSARTVKSKLVSMDTLRYLRDGQLLEVILSLKHEELVQFLKGASEVVRKSIFARSPSDLVAELEEELGQMTSLSKEAYQAVERKILNRIKVLANDGQVNLLETNERMFNDSTGTDFVQPVAAPANSTPAVGEGQVAA